MQGLITDSDRDSILRGLDEIERNIEEGEFIWRKDREDVHMNIEAALTDMIGEPAKKLHTARSRNDQVVTDLRLWCRMAINKIVVAIKELQVCSYNSYIAFFIVFFLSLLMFEHNILFGNTRTIIDISRIMLFFGYPWSFVLMPPSSSTLALLVLMP